METAKELAYKAFCHNNIDKMGAAPNEKEIILEHNFELWWSKYYGNTYQPEFNSEHSVFIDNKRYIKAE